VLPRSPVLHAGRRSGPAGTRAQVTCRVR
jgi:hypothetical protein